MPTQTKRQPGGKLLLLLGVPFFAIGCAAGYMDLKMVADHLRARGWTETPARILALDLKENSDSDGTTYKVLCTYRYTFGGLEHESSRVGLLSFGSDNIGSWHQQTYHRLQAAPRGQITCFVNPAHPDEAVLDREVRFGMLVFATIFAGAFGAAGAGMLVGGWLDTRRRRTADLLLARHPDQPWMCRPDWASGTIHSDIARTTAALWVVTVLWLLLTSPILAFLPHEVSVNHNYLALFGIILPAIGLIILGFAIWYSLEKRRFGRSHVTLETVPGVIGGHLRGHLVLVGDLTGLDEIDAELSCINTITTQSGGDSNTHKETIWSFTQRLGPVSAAFGQSEARLPFDFEIPSRCRPWDESDPNNKVTWKLTTRAPIPGVDLNLAFDMPVYRTADSPPPGDESAELNAAEAKAVDAEEPPPSARIRCEPDPSGGTAYTVSCWPGFRMYLGPLLGAIAFTGATVFLAYQICGGKGLFDLLFSAGVSIFALISGGISLVLWLAQFSFFGYCRVLSARDHIEVERHFGPLTRRRTVAAADVTQITVKQSASVSGTCGGRKWYAVKAETREGRKIQLASMIEGELAARWLARRIEDRLTTNGPRP